MNTEEYLAFHKKMCDDARKLSRKKNHDYAGADGDTPFANFDACKKLGLCSAETGFVIRILDKIMRQITYVKEGKLMVEGESFFDACQDIVNYEILFAAYCKDKAERNQDEGQT